ncbi:MAG: patatin-like phospholipase family protein, partial [Pseudomonadales bacterium]
KGLAYCGALKVLEDEGIYPTHIHRVAGTSSGGLFATLVAMGFTADELRELLYATDLVALMRDARFGRLSELVNLFTLYGFNPGFRLMEFLGGLLDERVGAADVTFLQLYERCGRELCVTITNITRMMTEYCHPKTTPDMPVRLAVSMSMSMPVLMQPYKILRKIGKAGNKEEDLYTDGGLLCNYPLHAFDGWWLSLEPADTFMKRMHPLKDAARFMHPTERFHPANNGTLGFTVFANNELDITRAWQLPDGGAPTRPETKLTRKRAAEETVEAERTAMSTALEAAFERLVDALDEVEQDGDGRVSRLEAEGLFDSGRLSTDDAELLFGTASLHDIFT